MTEFVLFMKDPPIYLPVNVRKEEAKRTIAVF